jgi:pentatricopeptide repeat protein
VKDELRGKEQLNILSKPRFNLVQQPANKPMSGAHICSQSCRITARRAVHVVRQHPCPGLRQHQQRHTSSSSYHLDDLVSELPRSTRYSRPRQRPAAPVSRQPESLYDYVAAKSTVQQSVRFPSNTPAQPGPVSKAQQHSEYTPRDAPRTRKARDASLTSYTSNLEDLIARDDADAAWSYFTTHYTAPDCAALDPARLPFLDVPKHTRGSVYTKLLSLMTRHWLAQLGSHPSASNMTSSSPCAVLDKYHQLAMATQPIASTVVLSLAIHLQLAASEGLDVLHHPATKPVLVQLLNIWPLCFYQTKNQPSYHYRFVSLLKAPTEKPSGFAISLLLVQDLLCRATSFPDDLEQHRPLLQALGSACLKTQLNQAAVRHIESRLRKETSDDVLASAELSRRLCRLHPASVLATTSQVDSASNESPTVAPQSVEHKAKWLLQKVSITAERQNLDILERLWTQAQEVFTDNSSRTPENAPLTLRLYEGFLHAFFQLRRPQSGLQVWNSMLQSGFEPTVRTWNVMMKGCHISRDINIMESMWQHMRDSGIQPDVVSWSTRIYGHFRVGSLRDGMSALEEMGREWADAQKRRRSKSSIPENALETPKPNTAILNTAISALRGSKASQIPSVLAWSRPFNIEPDVATYNLLLAISLSGGQSTDAANILQRMAASNVQPNSSTFTILVDSMLSTTLLGDMTHDEQKDRIMELISSFEQGGMNVDVQGYALLIDRMLKDHSNLTAARSVLAHMAARKVACTPHIYTILMTHYFDANPPELLAADALWNDIQNSKEHSMDVIFYDRMVEGFARHGDVGRTMAFLNRMSKEGKRPGWLAMTAVIQCLARSHEWDRVGQIVMDCHKQEGLLSVGLRGKKGQKDFWEYVGRLAENELFGSEYGRDIFAIVEAQREALGM